MPATTAGGPATHTLVLPNEEAIHQARHRRRGRGFELGDLAVTPSGDLGAGKTTFARALIRHLAGDPAVEVPSPTFTMLQTYELPRFTVVHGDLYRVTGPGELDELGLDDLPAGAVTLLEWPDRAASVLPPDRFDITFMLAPELGLEHRDVAVTGYGRLAPRAERICGDPPRTRRTWTTARSSASASPAMPRHRPPTRRLTAGDRRLIPMNSPRRPDGPPKRVCRRTARSRISPSTVVRRSSRFANGCVSVASRRRKSTPPISTPGC